MPNKFLKLVQMLLEKSNGRHDCILPYLYALYSVRYSKKEDDLGKRLAAASAECLCNDSQLSEFILSFIEDAKKISPEVISGSYKEAIDRCLVHNEIYGLSPIDYPRYSIVRSMSEYVCSKGASSLIDPHAGVGSFSLPLDTENFYGYTDSSEKKMIAEVLQDAFHLANAEMKVFPVSDISQMKDAEGLVSILPVDYGASNMNQEKIERIYIDLFDQYLFKQDHIKAAAIALNWNFFLDSRFFRIRKQLIEWGAVEQILSLEQWEFGQTSPEAGILYLDFTRRHEVFKIFDSHKIVSHPSFLHKDNDYDILSRAAEHSFITIPYHRIPEDSYCLHWGIYDYSDTKLEAGQELCPLQDFVTFDPYASVSDLTTGYIDGSRLSNILNNCTLPIRPISTDRIQGLYTVRGNRFAFTYSPEGEVKVGCVSDDGIYNVDEKVYTMRVNEEKISYEYLSYVLLNDQSFKEALWRFTAGGKERADIHILNKRRIPVWKDLSRQDELIEGLLPHRRINIVWADENINLILTEQIQTRMRHRGIVLLDKAGNFEELLAILKKSISQHSRGRQPDAVIMDPLLQTEGISSPKELYALQSILDMKKFSGEGKSDFAILLCSNLSDDRLAAFFQEHPLYSRYAETLRLFHKNENEYTRLFDQIYNDASAQNRGNIHQLERYSSEYAAAQWVDELLGTHSVDLIMGAEDKYSPADRNTGYDPIRIVIHGMIEKMQKMNLVPDKLSPGAVTELLYDGKYKDQRRNMNYELQNEIKEQMIPQDLALSLKYFTKVVNASIHGNAQTPALRKILIAIMAQAEIWFYNLYNLQKEELSLLRNGWKMKSGYEFQPFEEVVRYKRMNERDYWYCENVHLKFRPGLKEGCRVRIQNVVDEKIKENIDGKDIVWYSNCQNYEIINNED